MRRIDETIVNRIICSFEKNIADTEDMSIKMIPRLLHGGKHLGSLFDVGFELKVSKIEYPFIGQVKRHVIPYTLKTLFKTWDFLEERMQNLSNIKYQIIIAEHINSKAQEILKNSGRNFADLSGDMYLKLDGAYVNIKTPQSTAHLVKPKPKGLGTKKLKVLEHLIRHPEHFAKSIREFAKVANVSTATISLTYQYLAERDIVRLMGMERGMYKEGPERIMEIYLSESKDKDKATELLYKYESRFINHFSFE